MEMVFDPSHWSISAVGVIVLLSGVALVLIREALRRSFATTESHAELETSVKSLADDIKRLASVHDGRMDLIEKQMNDLPPRSDVNRIAERIATVETTTAVNNANLVAIKEIVLGIGRNVDLLMRYQMGEKNQ